jgi:tRNA1(Val) A37 N6-methylase TrmN6
MRAGSSNRPASDTSCVPMLAEQDLSEDAVLGGRLRLRQFKHGHRVGHDAILLAAACPGHAGERAADLGAGVGAAGLALAARVEGINVTLVEVDARLAAIARENAQLNELAARVNVANLDVMAPARSHAAAGLHPESLARVLMNPPFNDPVRLRASPDSGRQLAHAGPHGTLAAWVRAAARLLRPPGTLTLIWRADALDDVLRALAPLFGAATVLPIHPKPGQAAVRILVRATKGSRAPLTLLPGFVLNDGAGRVSAGAESVLRQGAILPLAEI